MIVTLRQKLTPPQYAARLGVDVHKVISWIKAGELKAIDAATRPGGRPRFLIDESDIAIFEARRTTAPTPRATRRRSKSGWQFRYF
jgi:transposase